MPFTIMEKEGKKPPKHGGFLFSGTSGAASPIANSKTEVAMFYSLTNSVK
jgi:hypothetical protein